MLALIGKKVGMTNIFDESGKNVPCTVIQAGPCHVTQVKTEEKDKYSAVQIGYGEILKTHKVNKPLTGHFKKSGVTPAQKLIEVRNFGLVCEPGDKLTVELFNEGDFVDVVGKSKGKGFQGVVKRHGFSGVGESTHGQHNRERAPGSIGASSYPSRVFKGMRMAGRTGGERVTVQNLKVVKVFPEKNVIVVSGAVPGHKNGYVTVLK